MDRAATVRERTQSFPVKRSARLLTRAALKDQIEFVEGFRLTTSEPKLR